MRAGIIIVGDEILAGHTKDANTPFLAGRLREMGHVLVEVRIVPDDKEAIVAALSDMVGMFGPGGGEGAPVPGLLFVCGGIGPTHDDVTVESVAAALGVGLEESPEMVERILEFYRRRSYCCEDGEQVRPNPASMKMAQVPRGMKVLKNDMGTAPGLWTRVGGEGPILMVLPGPPQEVAAVFEHSIRGQVVVKEDYVPVTAEMEVPRGESSFSHILGEALKRFPGIRIGSYPRQGVRLVLVRLSGPAGQVEEAGKWLADRLGPEGMM